MTFRTMIYGALAVALTFSAQATGKDGRDLRTNLTGASEIHGPGDPDGSDIAKLRIDTKSGEIC